MMLLKYGCSLKKYKFYSLIFILYLKLYFNTVYAGGDLYDSRSSSISEQEKNRRRKVVELISRHALFEEKDWVETYHETYPRQLALSNDVVLSKSSSHDKCSSDFTGHQNEDFSTEENISNCKKNDENKSFTKSSFKKSELKNELHENNELKNIKENSEEQNRRLNILNSFMPSIPGLEIGEYIPPE